MTEIHRLKRKLTATREADAKHEIIMQDAAQKAGRNLRKIRALPMRQKDTAIVEMFKKVDES